MQRKLSELENNEFDLLVIGGGIYGATVAWQASLHGLKVALVEKEDFACGTSANSQKIIHSGIRYLQNLDLSRVIRSIYEQRRLMWLAPHLVRPLQFLMPVYGYGIKGREAMSIAIAIHNRLSARGPVLQDVYKSVSRGDMLSGKETLGYLPQLNRTKLRGSALWSEGICENPERLVLAFVEGAVKEGAVAANYVEALKPDIKNSKMRGTLARDNITGDEIYISAKKTVDCSAGGFYIERNGKEENSGWIGGINLVIRTVASDRIGFGLRVPEAGKNGMLVTVPWRGKTILGTEWFQFQDPSDVRKPAKKYIQILIEKFNRAYPDLTLKLEDVDFVHTSSVPAVSSGSGKMKKKFEIQGEDHFGIEGFFRIVGVKFTTAAHVAERFVAAIIPHFKPYHFNDQPRLPGGEIDNFQEFRDQIKIKWKEEFPAEEIERLIVNYGMRVGDLLKTAASFKNINSQEMKILKAQILRAIRQEMGLSLPDVIFRRTECGTAGIPSDEVLNYAADVMGSELGWNQIRKSSEIEKVRDHFWWAFNAGTETNPAPEIIVKQEHERS